MSQPFAPATSYSFDNPNSQLQEIRLTAKEEHENEVYSEIFAIIKSLEIIEKSFIKDEIPINEYQELCYKLITQYQTLLKNNIILKDFQLDDFIKKYWLLNCSNGLNRLLIGIPATIEHSIPNSSENLTEMPAGNNKLIAEITSNFITLMDAIKLNFKTKDQLHPILSELLTNLTNFFKNYKINNDFQILKQNLIDWLIKLNKMKLNEELNDEELKTFLFDLECGYNGFYKILK